MRTAVAFVLIAGLAASLTACSSGPSTADCTPVASGAASDAVKVTGDLGTKPTATFTAPLSPTATQRTVVTAGDGKLAAGDNDLVTVDFTLYNGSTGAELTASPYTKDDRADFTVNENIYLTGLIKTLKCSTANSRVVGVIEAADAFGDTGSTDLGVTAGQPIVFVADIYAVSHGYATGESQKAVEGMPTVKLDKAHVPTVTIPDADPPADIQIALLKKGDGDVVKDGDTVKVQYYGINWNTGAVFDQSWNKSDPVSFTTGGVVAGFSQALIGQAVGSQVIVVVPPDLGYGPSGGSGDGSISATDTIVFVIDILGTKATVATTPTPAP